MKEAVKFGAEPVNYSKVKELLYEKGKVVGVLIEDLLSRIVRPVLYIIASAF